MPGIGRPEVISSTIYANDIGYGAAGSEGISPACWEAWSLCLDVFKDMLVSTLGFPRVELFS